MIDEIPDIELIRRALAGDQQGYREILKRYRAPLYNVLFRMVHNKMEAEDLVQEAFIKAFGALSTFNDEYAFSTWLFKIAINNCIDHLRKKRLKTFSLDKPIDAKDGEIRRELPDVTYQPENTLLSKEKTRLIEQAIQNLPEKYRVSIILRHTEEKSYEEISQILNIPLGTVKARIFRAREMLKKQLKQKLFP
ncbi:MAG: sigma-70 family RNA polymerase sigma factor [candidate division KSB1 bacterium]|nr:sigma-70 family RNA polymerase sigma factor [candidate division KSB1 bacterium]MDZ7333574.1 sigma-70 family RNA polymerase sigma factor [candidate division KSB1 bacterium]MDZ7357019.1 sigma-70 family RNA polymerase sigma factor [candidate division KSB1 bacterium]MDZ7398688.1 sigma-70 family RNA polymerase sigma factor [candidate division KSB1 bacterium]